MRKRRKKWKLNPGSRRTQRHPQSVYSTSANCWIFDIRCLTRYGLSWCKEGNVDASRAKKSLRFPSFHRLVKNKSFSASETYFNKYIFADKCRCKKCVNLILNKFIHLIKKKLQKTLILKNGSKNCWKKVVKKFKEDYC